jgi:hypothetical protein
MAINITENSPIVYMDLIRLPSGDPITNALIESVEVQVTDDVTKEVIGVNLNPDPEDVIFDTPVTDDIRYEIEEGYNFLIEIPGSYFPKGGKLYHVDFKFTPVVGNSVIVWEKYRTKNTYIDDVVESDE